MIAIFMLCGHKRVSASRDNGRSPYETCAAATIHCIPAAALGDLVKALAHLITGFPAAGTAAIRARVNAIALAPADDFRHDPGLRRGHARPRGPTGDRSRDEARLPDLGRPKLPLAKMLGDSAD